MLGVGSYTLLNDSLLMLRLSVAVTILLRTVVQHTFAFAYPQERKGGVSSLPNYGPAFANIRCLKWQTINTKHLNRR